MTGRFGQPGDPPAEDLSSGAALLSCMHAAARALQLYPADNEVVRRAIREVGGKADAIFAEEGGLSLWVAGSFIFVNDLRIRLDEAAYASFAAIREILRAHGIGRIDVGTRVGRSDWIGLLSVIAEEPEAVEDSLAHARHRLAEEDVSNITIGPPAALFAPETRGDDGEEARRTYARSVKAAREMMEGMILGKAIGARRAERAVLGIVDQVLRDRSSMLGMLSLRNYDDHSFIHSVNVAILAVALGDHLGFSRDQLFDLGFAALFHDIGKLLIPASILNKQGWLNDEEWRMVSQHPDFGFLMMFNAEGFPEPQYRTMLAIYEHHMKPDLSGYPRVIRRRRQGFFAKIIAVVEAYDCAISNYSKQFFPCSPDEAIRQLRDMEASTFDRVVVRAFVNMMGIYPVATLVILDTGEMGVVVAPNPNPRALTRPLVRLVADAHGERIAEGPIRDLTEIDPDTGKPRRTIARSTDPERYHLVVGDFVA